MLEARDIFKSFFVTCANGSYLWYRKFNILEADISQVHGMEIPGVVSWDCDSGQVWLTLEQKEVEVKELTVGLWLVCSITRLFENQRSPAGLERNE